MDTFFRSNPGFSSRIAHHIDFPDYSAGELGKIAEGMLERMQYHFDASAARAFDEYIERRQLLPHFANARSIRNALDRARLRQASRLCRIAGKVDAKALSTITEEDIRASRVFAESSRSD
jgi:hypothetical protein